MKISMEVGVIAFMRCHNMINGSKLLIFSSRSWDFGIEDFFSGKPHIGPHGTPWDPGALGPGLLGPQGLWDPGTLGPRDPGTGPLGTPGTLGPGLLGPQGHWDPGTLGPGLLGPFLGPGVPKCTVKFVL